MVAKEAVARIVLKGALTYKVHGRRWIKGVGQILKGSEIDQYVSNGYFTVTYIKGKEVEKEAKNHEASDDDEDESPPKKNSSSEKKGLSLKKRN